MRKASTEDADSSVAERLIEVAEELYGLRGLEGVSLRQISVAAGTGNNYAVQYHFGDAAGLIRQILERRMPDVERRRAQALSKAKAEGRLGDTRVLMDLLYRPLIEHRNSRGERSYARLVLTLQSSPGGLGYAGGLFHLMPIAEHVLDLIAAKHPEVPPELLQERQRLISIMVLTSIFHRRAPFADERSDEALVDNALDMATAALLAPVSPSIGALVAENVPAGP